MSSAVNNDLKKINTLSKQLNTLVNHATSAAIAEAKNAHKRKRSSKTKTPKTGPKRKARRTKSKKN